MSFFAFLLRSLPALALNNLDGRCLGDCCSQSNQIKIILQDVGGGGKTQAKADESATQIIKSDGRQSVSQGRRDQGLRGS